MSKFLKVASAGVLLLVVVAAPATAERFGLGRPAAPEEIAAWDLDVSPDGTGLPVGSGDVLTGEALFSERCAACHGEFAEGVDNWPELAGGEGTLDDKDPVKTVGSYWPHLSTAWDYVHRSMPFGAAQTLETDEVYAIVAYILYSNDLVDEEFELSNENFRDVSMPNADGFIVDDRDEVELPELTQEPCMTDCKESVEITMRAMVLDVTPGDDTDDAPAQPAEDAAGAGEGTAAEPAQTAAASAESAPDPELVAAGEKVFRKCQSCHEVGAGAGHKVGPHLNGIFGRTAGTADGFRYSNAVVSAGEGGLVWNDETMAAYLSNPRDYIKKNRMAFPGLKKQAEIEAVNAYLKSVAE